MTGLSSSLKLTCWNFWVLSLSNRTKCKALIVAASKLESSWLHFIINTRLKSLWSHRTSRCQEHKTTHSFVRSYSIWMGGKVITLLLFVSRLRKMSDLYISFCFLNIYPNSLCASQWLLPAQCMVIIICGPVLLATSFHVFSLCAKHLVWHIVDIQWCFQKECVFIIYNNKDTQ